MWSIFHSPGELIEYICGCMTAWGSFVQMLSHWCRNAERLEHSIRHLRRSHNPVSQRGYTGMMPVTDWTAVIDEEFEKVGLAGNAVVMRRMLAQVQTIYSQHMVLLLGHENVGKSSLVNYLRDPLMGLRGADGRLDEARGARESGTTTGTTESKVYPVDHFEGFGSDGGRELLSAARSCPHFQLNLVDTVGWVPEQPGLPQRCAAWLLPFLESPQLSVKRGYQAALREHNLMHHGTPETPQHLDPHTIIFVIKATDVRERSRTSHVQKMMRSFEEFHSDFPVTVIPVLTFCDTSPDHECVEAAKKMAQDAFENINARVTDLHQVVCKRTGRESEEDDERRVSGLRAVGDEVMRAIHQQLSGGALAEFCYDVLLEDLKKGVEDLCRGRNDQKLWSGFSAALSALNRIGGPSRLEGGAFLREPSPWKVAFGSRLNEPKPGRCTRLLRRVTCANVLALAALALTSVALAVLGLCALQEDSDFQVYKLQAQWTLSNKTAMLHREEHEIKFLRGQLQAMANRTRTESSDQASAQVERLAGEVAQLRGQLDSLRAAAREHADCARYMETTGCGWGVDYHCVHRGLFASRTPDDGTLAWKCCCSPWT